MKKQLTAFALTLCLLLTMVPAAFATGTNTEQPEPAEAQSADSRFEQTEQTEQPAQPADAQTDEQQTVESHTTAQPPSEEPTEQEPAAAIPEVEEPEESAQPTQPQQPAEPEAPLAAPPEAQAETEEEDPGDTPPVIGGFVDMPADEEQQQALLEAVSNGLMNGSDSTHINPTGQVTRASGCLMLVRAINATARADMSKFTDLKKGTWQYTAMARAYQVGIINGTTDTTMSPTAPVSRQTAYTMAARAFHITGGTADDLKGFSDGTNVSSWALDAIGALAQKGVITGTKLNAKSAMSRAEFAVMLNRLVGGYIDKAGTYSGLSISGGVSVRASDGNVVISNSTINGDLYVTAALGANKVTLKNTKVKGQIIVMGGKVSCQGTLANGGIRIYADSAVTSAGNSVWIEEGCSAVKLSGKVKYLFINAKQAQVQIVSGASVQEAKLYGKSTRLYGKGNVAAATLIGFYSQCTTANCTITDNSPATLYGGKFSMSGASAAPAGHNATVYATISGLNKTTAVTVYWYINGKQAKVIMDQRAYNDRAFKLTYAIPSSNKDDLKFQIKVKDKYGNVLTSSRTVKYQAPTFSGTSITMSGKTPVLKNTSDPITAKISGLSKSRTCTAIWYVNGDKVDVNNAFSAYNGKTSTYSFKRSAAGTYRITFKLMSEYGEVLKQDYRVKVVNSMGYDVTLGSYSTKFDASNRNRSTNLRLATQAINGVVLQPGETFSFNGTVGERTAAKGYKNAYVIEGGSYVMGLGGGVCQVSTTLFNACLRANMKISERHYHTISSTYVPTGADATVAYGSKDFKFTNNYSTPVKLYTTYSSSGTLSMSVKTTSGSAPDVDIRITHSGKSYTLRRYVNGSCNYTAYSYYQTIHSAGPARDPNGMFYVAGD